MHLGRPTSVSEVSVGGKGAIYPAGLAPQSDLQTDVDRIGAEFFHHLNAIANDPLMQKGIQGVFRLLEDPDFTQSAFRSTGNLMNHSPENLQEHPGPGIPVFMTGTYLLTNDPLNSGTFHTQSTSGIPDARLLSGSTPPRSIGQTDEQTDPPLTLDTLPPSPGAYGGESTRGSSSSLPSGTNFMQYAPIALGLSLTIGFAVKAFNEGEKSSEQKKMPRLNSLSDSPKRFAVERKIQRPDKNSNPSGWTAGAYSAAAVASLIFTGLYYTHIKD